MRVEYINPFVETSFRVLQEVLGGAEVKRGDLYLKSTAMPVMGVAALGGTTDSVEALIVPLLSDCGKIEVNVSIRERA